jgi:primase-polymerase (primpol)-like protein
MGKFTKQIPEEMIGKDRWGLWRGESPPDDPNGKPAKIPLQANGHRASSTNRRHWTRYDYVLDVFEHQLVRSDGLAYVFFEGDGITGVDLDDLWASESDEDPAFWGMEILQRFSDGYWEYSPGMCGVKAWVRAQLPEHRGRQWKVGRGAIELYDSGRFFA